MGNDIIKLKGTGDGVKIYLSSDVEFPEIINNLRHKLEEFRRFFGNGHCNIYFLGRTLEKSDMIRLEAIVSSMLPESSIYYGEKRRIKEEPPEIYEEAQESAEQEAAENESEFERIKDVVTTNFKSNRARFYEGTVRAGRTIDSDGHLILMGNIEKGAKVAAVGNIVVIGKLSGSAEAGCMGNKGAYIVAADFNPEKIKIAGVAKADYAYEGEGMKKAVLTDNQIYVNEYLVK